MSKERAIIPPSVLDGLVLQDMEAGYGCYPWEITPRQYLEYARQELEAITPRSLINAIGHAKRAIHAHVDFLLHNCGRCLRDTNFPDKLRLLKDLGIIAPNLLTKYNKLRNLLEHEYVSPSEGDALELMDVAELFLEATRCYTKPLPSGIALVGPGDANHVCVITCMWDQPRIVVTNVNSCGQWDGTWDISKDDGNAWMAWVSRILRLMQDADDPYVRCQ
jgi:hypothetical protein